MVCMAVMTFVPIHIVHFPTQLATFLFSNFATNEDAYVNTVLSVLKKVLAL